MDGCHSFFVSGDPVPKGSWDTFWNQSLGRCILTARNSKAATAWARSIKAEAMRVNIPRIMDGPVRVDILFRMPRAEKTPSDWRYRDLTPDVDKLERLVLDALTAVAWKDDKQVCVLHGEKHYVDDGAPTGAEITVRRLAQTETIFD